MAKPTAAEWKAAKEKIGLFSPLKLRIDGYDITIKILQGSKELSLYYFVYVDGKFDGKDIRLDSEIGKRFYMRRTHYSFPKEFRDKVKKGRKGYNYNYDKEKKAEILTPVLTNYDAAYTAFSTIKKVFIENNENIEII